MIGNGRLLLSKKKPPRKPGYRVAEWEEETSQFDPRGYWCYGSECYRCLCRCYVPIALSDAKIGDWIDAHEGDVVWIDDDGEPAPTSNELWDFIIAEKLEMSEEELRRIVKSQPKLLELCKRALAALKELREPADFAQAMLRDDLQNEIRKAEAGE